MKASLHSVRIAPKKANIVAKLVRGMPVLEAIASLGRTHKKAARMIEELLRSALANAKHNDSQDASLLVIKTIVVNQGTSLRRGVPMARGRVRPMRKFMSHIDVTLGIVGDDDGKKRRTKKSDTSPSTMPKNAVKKAPAKKQREKTAKAASSHSSAPSPSSSPSAS